MTRPPVTAARLATAAICSGGDWAGGRLGVEKWSGNQKKKRSEN